jgi:hypothetical protein
VVPAFTVRTARGVKSVARRIVALLALAAIAAGEPPTADLRFFILRNGDQIGTTTMQIRRDGKGLVAETKTHIQVNLGFVTLYRYDQTQTEHWADGHFVSLSSRTDDNGTDHKVSATAGHDAVSVDADGESKKLPASIIPNSLWNPALLAQTTALNPQDGSVLKLHAIDRGEDQLNLAGHSVKAHHYSLEGTQAQDVWYDSDHRLVRMEMRGRDGSKIEYRLD